mgnify:CR=1 FL=1|tara:strand:+ start:2450 stop:2692 length:243 start_codon:yes stop_codon:yes gene_type:complete
MTTEFYKDKVQKLQQKIDEQYEMIKHLKNELLLCKETDKKSIISKGRMTATVPPKFEGTNIAKILEERRKVIKRRNKKNE